MTKTANPPAITEVEARRRLSEAYAYLLRLARERRAEAQNADNRTPTDARTDNRDR